MTETQATHETRRHCKNCGLRVDGICTLTEAEQIVCMIDERTHWRLKIEHDCHDCAHTVVNTQVCGLSAEKTDECLRDPSRPHWRSKESINTGTGHARTCRCDTCLEYWERQQVEPDRVEGDGLDVDADEMVRGKVLKKALEIINGERQDSYGNPEDSFALIAEYWSTYLRAKKKRSGSDTSVYPIDVAEMMALFKIARMSGHRRQQPTTMQMQRGILGSRGIWYEH